MFAIAQSTAQDVGLQENLVPPPLLKVCARAVWLSILQSSATSPLISG
jgi:hypothetical protein